MPQYHYRRYCRMNLLFIQGGSRWKFDTEGNAYTDSNFNEHIWERYRSYCDHLTVILRREQRIYDPQEAAERFNFYDARRSALVALPDIYRPAANCLNLAYRRQIDSTIEREVRKADRVIIRSVGNVYTSTALKYARKYRKVYLVEVTGFAWEGLWYHSLRGKLVAGPRELKCRRVLKDVPYAVYVTDEALQKRYPCGGLSIGCSDVELDDMDSEILENRLKKIAGGGIS